MCCVCVCVHVCMRAWVVDVEVVVMAEVLWVGPDSQSVSDGLVSVRSGWDMEMSILTS